MSLPYFIARRYLFAKKSHNVINIISLISALGILVGSCALIVVLSVYNGFEGIVRGMYDKSAPDVVITPTSGKYFSSSDSRFEQIRKYPAVDSYSYLIEETVFLNYGSEQGVTTLKGVDTNFVKKPTVSLTIKEGQFSLYQGEIAQALIGKGLYSQMKISPRFVTPIEAFYPDPNREISLMNPLASLKKEIFFPCGIFTSTNAEQEDCLYVPIQKCRQLLSLSEDMVGAMELRLKDESSVSATLDFICELLGEDFAVRDRYMQNETVYKMMRTEKVVIYMILLFIIVVISCNVFGSLTMLIIEKRDDIMTLRYLGANDTLIKRIFFNEGFLIIMTGSIVGILLGLLLAMVQQYFGVIPMPGNFVVDHYPVEIRITDILITFGAVTLIGILITTFPVRKTLSKIL